MNNSNIIRKQWYVIVLVMLFLTGCSAGPEVILEGVREECAAETDFSEESRGAEDSGFAREMVSGNEQEPMTEEKLLQVFVCGAVEEPGVYQLQEAARVYEAVEAAGGFSKDADEEWLNLAAVLQDGMKLYIYTQEETMQLRTANGMPGGDNGLAALGNEIAAEAEKINLNTATKEQLMTLPGIGEAKADAVIAYREEQGSFQTIEEIMKISGIKEAVFLKIKDKITV